MTNLEKAEMWAYRYAIVELLGLAMDGGRKTIDKDEVARIADNALEMGNELFRRGKGLTS